MDRDQAVVHRVRGEEEALERMGSQERLGGLVAKDDQCGCRSTISPYPGVSNLHFDSPAIGKFKWPTLERKNAQPAKQGGRDDRETGASVHERLDGLPPPSLKVTHLDAYPERAHLGSRILHLRLEGKHAPSPPRRIASTPRHRIGLESVAQVNDPGLRRHCERSRSLPLDSQG